MGRDDELFQSRRARMADKDEDPISERGHDDNNEREWEYAQRQQTRTRKETMNESATSTTDVWWRRRDDEMKMNTDTIKAKS